MKNLSIKKCEEGVNLSILSSRMLHEISQNVIYLINYASRFILIKVVLKSMHFAKSMQYVLRVALTTHKQTCKIM